MRIIHTSDWHLGQHFYGKSRAPEHQAFLNWLLKQAQEQQVDAIVVSGDVFDTGVPPSYARQMYFNFVTQCHKQEVTLVVLAGNHDSVAMLEESKDVLAQLSTYVIAKAQVSDVHGQNKNNVSAHNPSSGQVFEILGNTSQSKAVICAIPFIRPRDAMLSEAGQSSDQKQNKLMLVIKEHYDNLYQQALKIAEKYTPRLPIIATGHLTAIGAKTSDSVRDIYIGTLDAFPAQSFPPADYIALGHIHQSQKVAKSDYIRYCGSPIPLSFDEAKQDKSVLLVDLQTEAQLDSNLHPSVKVEALIVPRFQPMAMLKTSLEDIQSQVETLITTLCEKDKTSLATESKVSKSLWLDIEIDTAEYLSDLTQRIENITAEYPIEILLVRRSKTSRARMPSHQKKVTLNELSLHDVFSTRIAQEVNLTDETNEPNSKTKRLNQLFKETLSEVENEIESQVKIDTENNSKKTPAPSKKQTTVTKEGH